MHQLRLTMFLKSAFTAGLGLMSLANLGLAASCSDGPFGMAAFVGKDQLGAGVTSAKPNGTRGML